MVKNEQLEDILDDLSVLKKNGMIIDKRLVNIESLLVQLQKDALNNTEKQKNFEREPKIDSSMIKICCDEVIRMFYSKDFYDQDSVLLLSVRDYLGKIVKENFHEVLNEISEKSVKEKKALEKERIVNQKIYANKRRDQGLETMDQVAEWAPEYPYAIQRWMRYMGRLLFDVNEDKEKVQVCVKSLGNIMLAAGNSLRPPTFKNFIRYKLNKINIILRDRIKIFYSLILVLGLMAVMCLALYQQKVMNMEHRNKIFYETIIKTREDAELLHKIDSIANS